MSVAEATAPSASATRSPPKPRARAAGLAGLDLPLRLARRLHHIERPASTEATPALPAPPPQSLLADLRGSRLVRLLVLLCAITALTQGLELTGWGLFGGAVLAGQPALWGLWGWLLLLATAAIIGLGAEALVAEIAIRAGAVVKRRLARGALGLDLDLLRRLGPSSLVTTALEAEALEQNGLGSALGLISGLVELSFLFGLCVAGAGGALHLLWLCLLLGLIAMAAVLYARSLLSWTEARLAAGTQLVEAIAGHRIWRTQWHGARRLAHADAPHATYLRRSTRTDARAQLLLLTLPSLWTLGSLLALLPAAAAGTLSPVAVAISIGAILMGARAINLLVGSLAAGLRAWVAARQLAPLLHAAKQPAAPPPPARPRTGDEPVFAARSLRYTHAGRQQPVLDGVELTISSGDHLLVEGPSGSGKSTFGAILTGLRQPSAGQVHRRGRAGAPFAMAAPQFHENHLFSATLLQNLYPAHPGEVTPPMLARGEALLAALGLGDLLARVPLGLMQRVGAGGWALSQGERSRVCLARALLADAELLVLDESLGALDPITAARCLDVATREARALVMIAHP